MGLIEADMVKKFTILVGFSGETKRTMGEISLPTYAQGMNSLQKFLVIDCQSMYNIILGRPWIHDLEADPFDVSPSCEISNTLGCPTDSW